ncbi:DctP family TRAP transporter solute-binding subunit [Pontibacillus yanchengensis]|uniref:DctP family TRAP transporter solute-binding subunit n=2 Tax=Pontibacillus yanchengensis TaxID=462910 RepID=A0A6I5A4K2_9BACI|nr:DctP family TRAP transporter solute-binding subunit [Pontibacillus yanchengensis]
MLQYFQTFQRGAPMKKVQWSLIVSIMIGLMVFTVYNFRAKGEDIHFDDEQEDLTDQIVIKFSHVVAENTPKGLAAQRFAKLVQKKTNNKVKVEVYPNGMLYSDEAEFEALKQGSIQMIAPASTKITRTFSELALLDLPYAFPNYEAVNKALTGNIRDELLANVKNDNMFGLAIWNNGFKQMTTSSRPLTGPSDFADQHFRVMTGPVIQAQFEALHAETSQIPFNRTYQNLTNQTITGQENTLSNIYSKRFYEVQTHMTISNHGLLSYVVLMNQGFWDKLSPELQQNIQSAMKEATNWNHQHAVKMNQQALKRIKEQSDIHIYDLPPERKEVWRRQFEEVYDRFDEEIGKSLMEELEELREKYK